MWWHDERKYICNICVNCRETYLKQNDIESGNDYQDRCIRAATNWYTNHMLGEQFILVTDDNASREIARQNNITTCKSKVYYKSVII